MDWISYSLYTHHDCSLWNLYKNLRPQRISDSTSEGKILWNLVGQLRLSIIGYSSLCHHFLSTPRTSLRKCTGLYPVLFAFAAGAWLSFSVAFILFITKLKLPRLWLFRGSLWSQKLETLSGPCCLYYSAWLWAAGITIYRLRLFLSTLIVWNHKTLTNICHRVRVVILSLFLVENCSRVSIYTKATKLACGWWERNAIGQEFIVITNASNIFPEGNACGRGNGEHQYCEFWILISGRSIQCVVQEWRPLVLFISILFWHGSKVQVQRYLSGQDGWLKPDGIDMNGFWKIPMQFNSSYFIGSDGLLCFISFFLPPVVFNKVQTANLTTEWVIAVWIETSRRHMVLIRKKVKASYTSY